MSGKSTEVFRKADEVEDELLRRTTKTPKRRSITKNVRRSSSSGNKHLLKGASDLDDSSKGGKMSLTGAYSDAGERSGDGGHSRAGGRSRRWTRSHRLQQMGGSRRKLSRKIKAKALSTSSQVEAFWPPVIRALDEVVHDLSDDESDSTGPQMQHLSAEEQDASTRAHHGLGEDKDQIARPPGAEVRSYDSDEEEDEEEEEEEGDDDDDEDDVNAEVNDEDGKEENKRSSRWEASGSREGLIDASRFGNSGDESHQGGGKRRTKKRQQFERRLANAAAKRTVRDWCKSGASVELSLRNRGLVSIPGLGRIARDKILRKSLGILDLDRNRMRSLPRHLLAFDCLSELHLDYNRLLETSFPEDMSSLRSLRMLTASHNSMRVFPRALATLPALEHLDLRDNELHTLVPPDDDGRFVTALYSTLGKNLKSLDLAMNQLEGTLDTKFCEAILKIEQLSIHTNNLSTLPVCFKFMDNLRTLRANGNPLQTPPPSVVLSGPEAVRQFFTRMSAEGVRHLNPTSPSKLAENAEQQQPQQQQQQQQQGDEDAESLSMLVRDRQHSRNASFEASEASIDSFAVAPSDTDEAQGILDKSSVQSSSTGGGLLLPQNSQGLRPRRKVSFGDEGDLCTNGAATPPPPAVAHVLLPSTSSSTRSISSESGTRVMVIASGGQTSKHVPPPPAPKPLLTAVPPATHSQTGAAVEAQATAGVTDQEQKIELAEKRNFKVVVLGNSSAGKSSLIRTLVSGECKTKSAEDRTFGVDIRECELAPPQEPNNSGSAEEPQKLTIWDFAGEDVYYHTHQLFLSRRSLYLLVWDINKHSIAEMDAEVCFWVYSVQARVPGAVIQIIASKTDQVPSVTVAERIALLQKRLQQHETWQMNDLRAIIHDEERETRGGGDIGSAVSVVSSQSRRRRGGPASIVGDHGAAASLLGGGSVDGDAHGLNAYHDIRPHVLLRQRPNVMPQVLEVSSVHNLGFETLRSRLHALTRDATLFPHMGSMAWIPRPWGVVEDVIAELRLARTSRPVCNWDELWVSVEARAQKCGVNVTKDDMEQCVHFLNDIGDVVHNRGTNILFLDSNWIVDCIKRIVDHKVVERMVGQVSVQVSPRGKRNLQRQEGRISLQVKHLKDKGILSEALVKRLWPELFRNTTSGRSVSDGLFHVLEQFDVCSPLAASPKDGRRWLIPCLIRHSFDMHKRWPRLSESCDDIQVGRSFVFPRFCPPGIMAKILTRIAKAFPPPTEIRTWKDATLVRLLLPERKEIKLLIRIQQEKLFNDDDNAAAAFAGENGLGDRNGDGDSDSDTHPSNASSSRRMSVDGEEFDAERAVLDVCAWGSRHRCLQEMWRNVSFLQDTIENILIEEYMGVTWFYLVRCPVCLSLLREQDDFSAAHSYHIAEVEQFEEDVIEEVNEDWHKYLAAAKLGQLIPVEDLCATMCGVESENIESHNTPIMWLMPPPEQDDDAEGAAVGSPENQFEQATPSPQRQYMLLLDSGKLFDARSICRIGVYCRNRQRFEEQGTGFVIDRHKGIIVSACHLITEPNTRIRKFIFEESLPKRILIGCFESQDTIPPWVFEAEIVSAGDTLPGDGSFLDVMVLRVVHRVNVLERSDGAAHPSSIFGRVRIERAGPASERLPLPAEIPPGDFDRLVIGHKVSLFGFPLRRGETICMSNGTIVGFSQHKREAHANAFQHDGSSGGPLVDSEGKVVGVLSKSTSQTLGVHISIKRVMPLLRAL
ncbi:Plant intracellular Ras-group-related LRR protein 4 [Durusdinium trenchii]|uniref:Plant intracellular Ras-group-related LRR protein 4 n=1 Tax=Durusdinium trenchii TaxID=1381693 RepID=A0ABP0ISN6_9DINO